jgi:hypothetical protein
MDGGVVVVLDLIGQRQVGRIEDAGLAAHELQQPRSLLLNEAGSALVLARKS